MRAFAADDEPKIIPHFIPQLRPYKGSLASSKHVAGTTSRSPTAFVSCSSRAATLTVSPRTENSIRASSPTADVQADADEDGESMRMET
jgi:hypothetical protein